MAHPSTPLSFGLGFAGLCSRSIPPLCSGTLRASPILCTGRARPCTQYPAPVRKGPAATVGRGRQQSSRRINPRFGSRELSTLLRQTQTKADILRQSHVPAQNPKSQAPGPKSGNPAKNVKLPELSNKNVRAFRAALPQNPPPPVAADIPVLSLLFRHTRLAHQTRQPPAPDALPIKKDTNYKNRMNGRGSNLVFVMTRRGRGFSAGEPARLCREVVHKKAPQVFPAGRFVTVA